jgi:phosphoserine aminotransferase
MSCTLKRERLTLITHLRSRPKLDGQFNFSGGPGALPTSVLQQAQHAIAEIPGQGLSVLGISHRSPWFRDVVEEAAANIAAMLALPDHYRVLFLQGGGSLQFSMVPMTLLRGSQHPAEYLQTGYWSSKALVEARREGPVRVVWSGESSKYSALPHAENLQHSAHAPYLHFVSNETVEGLQFHELLGLDDVLRVCDMSSDFLSRPFNMSDYGLVYAHAQKNLGPAGVTVVIIREDILARVPENTPAMLDYREHARMGSIYNTAPVFSIYVTMLVTRWLRFQMGGLAAMAAINENKAAALYSEIDGSDRFYLGHAARGDRSLMNVTFRLPSAGLERRFLEETQDAGFYGLEGHRSLGGVRASIYNAVTPDAVDALCEFMNDFRQRHATEVAR